MPYIMPPPKYQFEDGNGSPLVSGLVYFYEAGTTNLKDTYPTYDEAAKTTGAIVNDNPIVLNARGEAPVGIFFQDSAKYKVRLADSSDAEIYTIDNVSTPFEATAANIGVALWPRNAAEIAAGVTPSDYGFIYKNVKRYGALGDASNDDVTAFNNAESVGDGILVPEGNFRIGSSTTLASDITVEIYGVIEPDAGATLTLGGTVEAGMRKIFGGSGNVTLTKAQQVWVDWWDRSSLTCAQDALDNTAQGSGIQASGRYNISGITAQSDEDAGTGDQGKAFIGMSGAPGTRLDPGTWGAEFVLDDDAGDADVLYFNGTNRGGNNGSRISFTCRGIKFDGNKIRVSSTATAGGTATLTDSAASWTVDQWVNFRCKLTTGTGAGQYGIIRSNTATVLTISHNWATAPDNTTDFQIEANYRRDTGTATAGAAQTITDSSKNWAVDSLAGMKCRVLSGTGIGSNATISSNTATTITVDTAWAVNPASGSVYIVEATKASGINLNFVKDIWLENVYCANNGVDGIRSSEGSVNQLHMDYVEVWANGRDGLGFGAIGDYTFGVVKTFINDRNGIQAAAGNAQGNTMHSYLNKGHGCTLSAVSGQRHFSSLRSTDNVQAGLNMSGDENFISHLEVSNNGRPIDPAGSNGISASANGYTGTASSGSTTTIVDTSQTFETNLYAGEYVHLTEASPPSGNTQYDEKLIDSNDATTLNLNSALGSAITTDQYAIGTQSIERANVSARSTNSQNNWIGLLRSESRLDVHVTQYDYYASGAAAAPNIVGNIITDGNAINGIAVDSGSRVAGHRLPVKRTATSSTTIGNITFDKSLSDTLVVTDTLTGGIVIKAARATDAADGEKFTVMVKSGAGNTVDGDNTTTDMPQFTVAANEPLVVNFVFYQGIWYGGGA